jgi:molybdenum cofactor cytidylyltransferase
MRVAGIVLAAGQSRRMGENKLLSRYGGHPLVIHAVDAALEAGLDPVCVVTGHERVRVEAAVRERTVRCAHNAAFADGLSGSLAAGIAALDAGCDAAVVLLGDMPKVRAEHVARLLAAFAHAGRDAICVSVHAGQRGNPVLWPARDFPALAALRGDGGARALVQAAADRVQRVSMPDDAVLIDVDSPADLHALTAVPAERTETAR